MDTELLRTFLEVKKTRHFARAAQNLFVTQAAVSARINQLEGVLGQRLFTRTRNNIQLTTTGHQLVPYAETILSAWSRALLASSAREGSKSLVVLGCLPSLREIYLDSWLLRLLETPHQWLLQVESRNTSELVASVRDSAIGIGMLYEPPRAADLWVMPLTRFDLILVASMAGLNVATALPDYLYVDWGSSFAVAHNAQLADRAIAETKVDTPLLAKQVLLRHGGTAYLASPMIDQDLEKGYLHRVVDAPVIEREVFLIGRKETENEPTIMQLREALLALAAGDA
jgi:DNA-binding transcriptional LysR family regulator